jgi:hypothetical protein
LFASSSILARAGLARRISREATKHENKKQLLLHKAVRGKEGGECAMGMKWECGRKTTAK